MITKKRFSDKEIKMEELIELEECPACRGNGMIIHEGGWNVQVECADCGSHTVYVEYENEEQKAEAVRMVARLWNLGKVIKSNPGE
jgi:hypothetical protein